MFACRQLHGVKLNLFFFGRVISQWNVNKEYQPVNTGNITVDLQYYFSLSTDDGSVFKQEFIQYFSEVKKKQILIF